MSDRTLPANLDAEASVLGCVLLRPDAMTDIAGRGLREDDFFDARNRATYAAMRELDEVGKAIDLLTVADALARAGMPGMETRLADLAAKVPTAENSGFYAQLVRDTAQRRKVIAACVELSGRAYDGHDEAQVITEQAALTFSALAERDATSRYVSVRECATEVAQEIGSRADRGGITGVTTGYGDLDAMTCGLQPESLVILAARPSVGKTALALNVVRRSGVPSLVFSLEMGRNSLVERTMVAEGSLDGSRVRTGKLSGQEWQSLTQAMSRVASMPIAIDDSPTQTLSSIRARAKAWKRQHQSTGIIVIDYLQLMDMRQERGETRDQAIGRTTRGLKALAKELAVPVMALSQLNRKVESREDKRPNLSDLRESGSIEQDADLVIFLHRPKDDDGRDDGTIEVIVEKQRNGPTGIVNLVFLREQGRFEPRTLEQYAPHWGDQ